jgi:hypothetical protein
MPAKKPDVPRPRDQVVPFNASSDQSKQRMLSELARLQAVHGTRVAELSAPKTISGSRGSGVALQSVINVLVQLGLAKDETTP